MHVTWKPGGACSCHHYCRAKPLLVNDKKSGDDCSRHDHGCEREYFVVTSMSSLDRPRLQRTYTPGAQLKA